MSKKVTLPRYEQMILDVAGMKPEELEILISCAKVRLSQLKPRAPRKSKPKPVQEKASA